MAGIAWQVGLVAGLAELGIDLRQADLVVGTSAGATVGAQITSPVPLGDLVARQMDGGGGEIGADYDLTERRAALTRLLAGAANETERLQRIGAMALAAQTIDEGARRQVIEQRLPSRSWPQRPLRLTAVDALSGELVIFDRDSGVDLADAVAASCAVPGVWPPVTIGGRRCIDGGARSSTNLDVAAGSATALVLAPLPLDEVAAARLDSERAVIEGEGGRVLVIGSDLASLDAIGSNPLDPATRGPAAKAGLAQAQKAAEMLAGWWT